MTQRDQLARLGQVSQLILDLRLSELHTAARARQDSLDRLAGLAAEPADGLSPIAAARAELHYQRWAEARRAEINLTLARQTADWLGAQAAARRAFGQAQALRGLAQKG
ncbi:hypothetical protein RNZ50_23715 [Paracoccaceae bacterium Fryx2]|nr:hypothetical protein [Paracoccaceae bacterium Fryx2]